ncbi:MAG: RluA family pseudouridine synthase [Bdellovibrionales bacterium]|nr:RluA family pseudouridine synthase [Bdellovibrionales bacterium]
MPKKFALTADLSSQDVDFGLRADRYLTALFSEQEGLDHLSRSQVQRLIENGGILIDSRPIRAKDPVATGAMIEVFLPDPVGIELKPENIPVPLLYEDEHLVVVNKPPGLTVHPSETQKEHTLVNALLYHIKDLSGIGGKLRPGIVHRIDKDTSGALVISKHDEAHLGLSKLFAKHDIRRKYWAICYGSPRWHERQTVKTLIGRSPSDRKKMSVNVTDGREAISHFELEREFAVPSKTPFGSLIEAALETGRTHQVRVHLNHLGYSIMGDPVYGTPASSQPKWKNLPKLVQAAIEELPGQALHARVLGFKHPITGKEMCFEAPPFEAFNTLLTSCLRHSST